MIKVSPLVAQACFVLLAVSVSACGNDTPTSPTTTTTTETTTVETPTTTEQFVGRVAVSGSVFYSFTVTQYGTVNITLTDVSGQFVPPTVTLGLGIGIPSGEGCSTSSTVNTKSGTTAQITGAYNPGVYCAQVFDVGNLFAPANVVVTITYP
jgi:hypothetical protein